MFFELVTSDPVAKDLSMEYFNKQLMNILGSKNFKTAIIIVKNNAQSLFNSSNLIEKRVYDSLYS